MTNLSRVSRNRAPGHRNKFVSRPNPIASRLLSLHKSIRLFVCWLTVSSSAPVLLLHFLLPCFSSGALFQYWHFAPVLAPCFTFDALLQSWLPALTQAPCVSILAPRFDLARRFGAVRCLIIPYFLRSLSQENSPGTKRHLG